MRLAIIGSRTLSIKNIGQYLPQGVTEIVSGGARGIDTAAAEYAKANGFVFTEFSPDYAQFKKSAPLKRNLKIAQYADAVLAFWDGISKGTMQTMTLVKKLNKPNAVILLRNK